MIQDEITDVLLRARIPASTKGFLYIHDALEIMDQDPYYFSGKVCALYTKIAKQHGASFSQVERAIRYAFKSALTHGDSKSVERYLDPVNTQNSNELKGKSQAFIAHKFSPFILSNFNMTIWPPSIPLVGSLRFPLLCSSCPLQFPPFSHVSHTAYADSPISRKQARKATSLLIYPSIFRG